MKNSDVDVLRPIASLPRKTYPVKVLQFGTGNFLRGFADWMMQRANDQLNLSLGVTAIQSVSHDDFLLTQQGLFTVVERGLVAGAFQEVHQRIDVIQRVVNTQTQFASFLEEAENPWLKVILSNTTELGIHFNELDSSVHEPARAFPGKLTQFLLRCFARFPDKRLIILPCELIERNGDQLRACVLRYATHWKLGAAFENYVHQHAFCNTLVDRIVPGKPADEEALMRAWGYRDALITSCEPYHLWAVEAPDWVAQEFPLHQAGVNFIYTDNLEHYRVRKVRILNGSHSIMAPVGYLAGVETVQEAMEHRVIGPFIKACLQDEIVPSLPGDQKSLQAYSHEVQQRFLNPAIRHALLSITLNSFSKWRVRLVPSIESYYQKKEFVPERICFGLAAQFFLYRGLKSGREIGLKDDPAVIATLRQFWQEASFTETGLEKLVGQLLSQRAWWGKDLNDIRGLREKVGHYLYTIDQHGILAGIDELHRNLI